MQKDVFSSLARIFTDMNGFKQERQRLAKKYNTSQANAQRLLKTEIARINADTELMLLKENDFTHLIYVAESGACDICKPLDRKAIPINKGRKKGLTCTQCTLTVVVRRMDISKWNIKPAAARLMKKLLTAFGASKPLSRPC
jgi:hypothetical protein